MYCFNPKFKRKNIPLRCKHEVLARDKLMCVQCGKELFLDSTKKQLSVKDGDFHHILPLVYGGANETLNLCLLCRPCHKSIHSGDERKAKYFTAYENFLKTGRLGGDAS